MPEETPQNQRARFRRGFRKRIKSRLLAVGCTFQHTPLLTVKWHIVVAEVEAVVDTGESASVVGKRLAHKLGIWKRARKSKVRQEDRSILGRNFIVNTSIEVMDSSSVLDKFAMNAKALDIGHRDVILRLS